ncbi:pyridoxal phosphate-dependent decarboxylase family protein [Metabacillus sp. SLBN-84]
MTTILQTAFDRYFLTNSKESLEEYQSVMNQAMETLKSVVLEQPPFSGAEPQRIKETLQSHFPNVHPNEAMNSELLFQKLNAAVGKHSISVHHPSCAAHLHCPPMLPGLAAEVLISGLNVSMDSWDQSGAATMVEQMMMDGLCRLFGLPEGDGVMTSGGTQSNLMGLMLAREHACMKLWNWDVKRQGLPPEQHRLKILCSDAAHFSVQQSAAVLGLGEDAVVPVKTDHAHRMCMKDLVEKLQEMRTAGEYPFVLFATAGTTDFGAIDPLREMSRAAKQYGLWFHVDAAYGGGLIMTELHKHKLTGIEEADSITVDFHKMFYQPISCGAFLVKERSSFAYMKRHADYLNPEEDDVPNLVGKSLQTTRRFDALKPFLSFQLIGKNEWSDIICRTLYLAKEAYSMLKSDGAFTPVHEPELSTVVFRYTGEGRFSNEIEDLLNSRIRDRLLNDGEAIIARTKVNNRVCLKFTLLNPLLKTNHLSHLLQRIKEIGRYESGRLKDEQNRS